MFKTSAKAPWPVIVLIVAFLCPTEFSIFLGGLRIPPHRAALMVLIPIALWRFANHSVRIRAFDVSFLLFNVWTVAVFMHHHPEDNVGLVYGGSLAIDGLGAYLVGRVWIRTHDDFRALLRLMTLAVIAAAAVALPETLLGQNFTHDLLRDLTGYTHPTAVEHRLGLTRAYGSFDHPIHYGTFCAAFLAMFWFAARNSVERGKAAVLLTGATFLGLSSAPILCLLLQGAMIIWERLTRGTNNRTSLTLVVLSGLYIGAAMVMERSPINLIATGMTLDSWTGYYRLQIWENGLLNVYANPWTGLGLNNWDRPWWMVSSTVDAFWLVIVMRTGLPALGFLFLGIYLIGRGAYKRGLSHPDIAIRRLTRGWFMSLIALSLVGVTVHYWNVLYAFFFFYVSIGGWIADPVRVRAKMPKLKSARSRNAPAHGWRDETMVPSPA